MTTPLSDMHMNPLTVVLIVIVAVLTADLVSRTISALFENFIAPHIIHRKVQKPASVDEVFELLKVIADRQGNILRYLADNQEFHRDATATLKALGAQVVEDHDEALKHIRLLLQRQLEEKDKLDLIAQYLDSKKQP